MRWSASKSGLQPADLRPIKTCELSCCGESSSIRQNVYSFTHSTHTPRRAVARIGLAWTASHLPVMQSRPSNPPDRLLGRIISTAACMSTIAGWPARGFDPAGLSSMIKGWAVHPSAAVAHYKAPSTAILYTPPPGTDSAFFTSADLQNSTDNWLCNFHRIAMQSTAKMFVMLLMNTLCIHQRKAAVLLFIIDKRWQLHNFEA